MTAIRRCAALRAALAALLAACQPLPHPFSDDRPPAALLRIDDVLGVSIAPLVGEPSAVAEKLGAATASALLKRDIPASEKTANLRSYQLYGRIAAKREGKDETALTALWRLYDAGGRTIGEPTVRLAAKTGEWQAGDAKEIEQLASLSAVAVVKLLREEAPTPAAAPPPAEGRLRVAVESVGGAPGDGATSLAAAVATVLKRQDLAVVDGGGKAKADLYVRGEVSLTPEKRGQQHVRILWHVRRADGAEIGTVGQENDVPRGMLDGPWGDVAYTIALAASDGLLQLLARGAPPSKS